MVGCSQSIPVRLCHFLLLVVFTTPVCVLPTGCCPSGQTFSSMGSAPQQAIPTRRPLFHHGLSWGSSDFQVISTCSSMGSSMGSPGDSCSTVVSPCIRTTSVPASAAPPALTGVLTGLVLTHFPPHSSLPGQSFAL